MVDSYCVVVGAACGLSAGVPGVGCVGDATGLALFGSGVVNVVALPSALLGPVVLVAASASLLGAFARFGVATAQPFFAMQSLNTVTSSALRAAAVLLADVGDAAILSSAIERQPVLISV